MSNAKHGMPGRYQASPPDLVDGAGTALLTDEKGRLVTTLSVTGSDIQLGAVELKNGTDDTRAVVGATGLVVSLGSQIAGEDLVNDVQKIEQRTNYTNITVDTLIKTGAGRFYGFIVNSHTSGTIKIWDNTSAATTVILDTITLAAGPQSWVLPVAIDFSAGLYVDIGGTINVTILWK